MTKINPLFALQVTTSGMNIIGVWDALVDKISHSFLLENSWHPIFHCALTIVTTRHACHGEEKRNYYMSAQDLLFSLLTSSVCGIIISPGTNLHHPRNTNDPNEIH